MTNLVPAEDIERIVGASRARYTHLGRMVSGNVYILHSRLCKYSGIDLRECPFSVALDNGIDFDSWESLKDQTVYLDITPKGLLTCSTY